MANINQKVFDLEYQYQLYLKRVGLDQKKMTVTQGIETKRAFYGACGQLLIMLRDDLGALPEKAAEAVFENLIEQVGKFWEEQL